MKNGKKIFWGLFLIIAAVFLVVTKMGYCQEIGVFSLLLTVFFAACLIKSIVHISFSGILFSIAFLCIIYAKPLGIEALTPWTVLGAALLGSIGLSMIFRPKWKNKTGTFYQNYCHHQEHFDTVDQVDGDQVAFGTSWGSSIKYVHSENFSNAAVRCSFGAMKVYFDNVRMAGDSASVLLDVSFAGVELFMPKTWTVVCNADTSFGGLEEKNRNIPDGTRTLYLTGKIRFAGVTIIYV